MQTLSSLEQAALLGKVEGKGDPVTVVMSALLEDLKPQVKDILL